MAIKNWHPGQLAVVWVAALFACWILYNESVGTGIFANAPPTGSEWIVIGIPAFVALLVSWVWFKGR